MKLFFWCVLMSLLPVGGFCQWNGLNPPIDPRTNMEGFPASPLATQPPSLKDLSSKQVQFWQARKSASPKRVKEIFPDKAVVMSYTGAINGKQFISQIETGVCKVNSFKLDDFAFRLINSTSGVLTYHAIQDAMCTGKPLPQDLQVEIGYLNNDGRWKIAFYVEDKPNHSKGRTGLPK